MHKENGSLRSTDTQVSRTDKPQSETAKPANTRCNQMAKGKHKNITNRNQGNISKSEPSSPGYSKILEKQDLDLKTTSHDADRGFQEGHKYLP